MVTASEMVQRFTALVAASIPERDALITDALADPVVARLLLGMSAATIEGLLTILADDVATTSDDLLATMVDGLYEGLEG